MQVRVRIDTDAPEGHNRDFIFTIGPACWPEFVESMERVVRNMEPGPARDERDLHLANAARHARRLHELTGKMALLNGDSSGAAFVESLRAVLAFCDWELELGLDGPPRAEHQWSDFEGGHVCAVCRVMTHMPAAKDPCPGVIPGVPFPFVPGASPDGTQLYGFNCAGKAVPRGGKVPGAPYPHEYKGPVVETFVDSGQPVPPEIVAATKAMLGVPEDAELKGVFFDHEPAGMVTVLQALAEKGQLGIGAMADECSATRTPGLGDGCYVHGRDDAVARAEALERDQYEVDPGGTPPPKVMVDGDNVTGFGNTPEEAHLNALQELVRDAAIRRGRLEDRLAKLELEFAERGERLFKNEQQRLDRMNELEAVLRVLIPAVLTLVETHPKVETRLRDVNWNYHVRVLRGFMGQATLKGVGQATDRLGAVGSEG